MGGGSAQGAEVEVAPGTEAEVGRRERKKAQTRQALIDTAWDLFQERGYAATTIEDITERVDVSVRTFFRYFPSKEAVVFADIGDKTEVMEQALAARPDDEPVLESLRQAIRAVVQEVADDPERAVLVGKLCQENPALDEYRHGAAGNNDEEALLAFLKSRMGDDEMAPYVIAAALRGAMTAAWDYWVDSGQKVDMVELLDQAVDALEKGFSAA